MTKEEVAMTMREELRQCVLDSMVNESIRNNQEKFYRKGHKYNVCCSCSLCHLSNLVTNTILSELQARLPKPIETISMTGILTNQSDWIYGFNECLKQVKECLK